MPKDSDDAGLDVLTPADRVQIAAVALCDPKTVLAWLKGRTVRPSLDARIVAALRARGWLERGSAMRESAARSAAA